MRQILVNASTDRWRRLRRHPEIPLAASAGPASTPPAGTGPAVTPAAVPTSTATALPGTVLRDCQSSNGGTVSRNWKASSVHAGPVWFIFARPLSAPPPGYGPGPGKATASAMVIAVRNGRTAVVTAPRALDARFRFLRSSSSGGNFWTLSGDASSLTLAGCPVTPAGTHIPVGYAAGLTMFWEGCVTNLKGCIPLEVRTSSGGHPVRVFIAPGNGGCGS